MSDRLDGYFHVTFTANVRYPDDRTESVERTVCFDHSDVTHMELRDVFKDFLRGIGYIV